MGAGPATLGLGPLRRSSGELCLPDGATQATTVATAVQAAVVLTLILALALTWIGALGCASGRLTAVRAVGSSPSHGSLGWARVAQAARPTQGARRPHPAPRPAPAPGLQTPPRAAPLHRARTPPAAPCSAAIARSHALAAHGAGGWNGLILYNGTNQHFDAVRTKVSRAGRGNILAWYFIPNVFFQKVCKLCNPLRLAAGRTQVPNGLQTGLSERS